MSVFGDRLRTIREENNMLAKDLAKLVGVEPAAVTNWEKGVRFPKDNVILRIAEIFNVTTDFLLGRDVYQSYSNALSSTESTLRGVKLSTHQLVNIDKEVLNLMSMISKAEIVEFDETVADEDDLQFLNAALTKFLSDIKYYNKLKNVARKASK